VKIIAVASAKGGVGKTSLAANLGSALALLGKRVVTVDLDPQNALRLHFGLAAESVAGIARATLAGAPWRTVLVEGGGVRVLPFGALNETDRRAFEQRLDADPDWLGHSLDQLDLGADDLVLVDTPPGPSVYLKQALSTAQFVVTVVLADAASYATLPMMAGLLATYCLGRADFAGAAYLVNQVDQSRQLAADVIKVLRGSLAGHMFPGVIHEDQAVSEALAMDTTVLHYDPHGQASQDFRASAAWLLDVLARTARRSA
jgi:cellulose synthase operon protein YhjQ